jgi:hypothetical protein
MSQGLPLFRSRLLGSTALALLVGAATLPAIANDVTVNGVPAPDASPLFILVAPGNLDTVVKVNTQNLNSLGDAVRVIGFAGATNVTVDAGRTVNGAANGVYLTSTTGNMTTVNNGSISGVNAVVMDARFLPLGGDVTLSGTGSLTGTLGPGAWLLGDTGTVSMNGMSSIAGGTFGVLVETTGAVNLGTTSRLGPITSVGTGIQVTQVLDTTNNGVINVSAGNITSSAGYGVRTVGWEKATAISTTGAIKSGLDGIYGTSTTGNIAAAGGGTGTVVGGLQAITLGSFGGNLTVQDYQSLTGAATGVWLAGTTGTANISGNGPITGSLGRGILATTTDGAINIGTTKFNGTITGSTNGIEAVSVGTGGVTVKTSANVTGTGNWGIFAASTNGNANVTVTAGTVSGGDRGIEARANGTGNASTDVNAGSVVQGGNIGLLTGTLSGVATTTNAGTIRTTADTGAASSTGGVAQWAFAGNSVVDNTGQLIGSISTIGSLSYALNNKAGGVWTPSASLNAFGGLNDTVNNAGTINIRAGTTTFTGLEALNNLSGGMINLGYNAAATDNLGVLNISPKAGSAMTFNFDAAAANNAALGFDNTSNGKGTADTIVVVGKATPASGALVNLVATGAPTAQTGSVALVYTGINLVAPKIGDTITASSTYKFGTTNLTAGKTAYYLVDDGNGGVYLQWAPNLSATALGGYGGAVGTGTGAPGSPSVGSVIGGAAGPSAGIGGVGFGGGPTGGGVTGRIGDLAASSVLAANGSVVVGTAGSAGSCRQKQYPQGWAQVDGEWSRSDGGGRGQNESLSGGVDVDVGEQAGLGCNRLAFGMFGFGTAARNSTLGGSNNSDTSGIGGYVRLGSVTGFYGALLGAVSWSDAQLSNLTYNSTADKHSMGLTGTATLGYLAPLMPGTAMDFRGFASSNRSRGGEFTDSVGISVSETRDDIRTYGISIGLHQAFNPSLQGFLRAGVKWSDLDSSITSFGVVANGAVKGMATSIEAGLVGTIGKNVELGASGFSTFGDGTTGYGAKATLGIKF